VNDEGSARTGGIRPEVLRIGLGLILTKAPWLEPSPELAAPGTPAASMDATQTWSAPSTPLRLLWPSRYHQVRVDGHKWLKGHCGADHEPLGVYRRRGHDEGSAQTGGIGPMVL